MVQKEDGRLSYLDKKWYVLSVLLGTKYLNEIFTVTRQVKNTAGAIIVNADYSQLGRLLITTTVIGLVLPAAAIILVKLTPLKAVGDTKRTQ